MTDNFLPKTIFVILVSCSLELIKKGQYRNPYPGEVVFVPTPEIQSQCWCRTWLVSAVPSNLTAANGNLSGALQETEGKEKGGQNL